MNVYDQLLMEFPGIETTLTSYSSECHATMLLPSLKQALTNYDKERALYCLGEMDNWYQKNLSKIYSNSYVFHKDEHLRVAELIHLSIQKISESEVAPKSTAIGNEDTPDSTEPIIFLSHCSSDKTYGDILEKFIMGLGVKREQLIYSSHPLHKIPLDQNIFNYLRKNINREIFMIILWSNDYLESPACMNELGAAWVAQCDYTNIYTPDFAFGNPKYHRCAVDTQKMGAVLNGDANCRQSMLELKDKIVNFLDLAPDEAQVLYLLDEFTNSLKAISKTSDRNSAENDIAVRNGGTGMSFSDWIGIWSLIVGVVGAVVGIIGCLNLSKANKIAAKCITNSKITQAETLIVNNGVDTYAVIKIAKETTQEELKNIVDNLAATTLDLKELQKQVDEIPRIYSGKEPPPDNLRDGDAYLQLESEEENTHV